MIDLLGIVGPTGPSLPCLPSERWLPDQACYVDGPAVRARYLPLPFGPVPHAADTGYHVFVIGELFGRGDYSSGPLSAQRALDYRRDPAALLRQTKGNFVLVIVDERNATCELIGSRLLISPFYYALDGPRLIFSTSLASVAACLQHAEVDHAAVAEHALFNYPLGRRTFIRGVYNIRPAERVRLAHGRLDIDRWWDVRSLYDLPLMNQREALDVGSGLLHATVNHLAADQPRLRVSFTSGFDSRVNLAVLDRPPEDILAYSFGTPGSINVAVPHDICARLGVRFEPIYLDDDYAAQFDDFALRALMLSDCLSTVERANYPYAFERTAGFGQVVLTGLFGSELLRTFQNIGYIVSADLVQLHLSTTAMADVAQLVERSRYIRSELVRDSLADIQADVADLFDEGVRGLPTDRRFYVFLLSEGLRKYFGAETHIERPWGLNRFPFLDEEFVEFAFRAPFAGVHSRTLQPTIGNRFRSQYFYAHVIRRYRPELLQATTDHGYAPADLLGPLPLLRIAPKVLARRRRQAPEFRTEEWTAGLYQHQLLRTLPPDDIFTGKLGSDFEDGSWLANRLAFARAASLKLWLERM
ncbi:MAG TPA: hypothetical protein VGL99_29795 [Chloroflexota bacterium]